MNIKLVIFDLDGTLVDSIEGIATSVNLVLAARNMPTLSVESYKGLVGNGLKELIGKVMKDFYSDEETLDQAYRDALGHYLAYFKQGLAVYKGIEDLLDQLTQKSIHIGVNTNKNQEMTEAILSDYFDKWEFVKVIGAESGYERKPHPHGALSMAEQVGLNPKDCLYVGDSEVDFLTAQNAGMKCVLVTWGFRTEEALALLNHKHMAHMPQDILKYL